MDMKTIYDYKSTIPFSLHDMIICKIEMADEDIRLYFKDGFVELKEPYKQVEGDITIEGVDLDFCCIYLLSENGQYGNFQGKKMTLAEFLDEYSNYSFEVVDEMYGYNQVSYSGYLSLPNAEDLREIQMSIYYTGSIIYTT